MKKSLKIFIILILLGSFTSVYAREESNIDLDVVEEGLRIANVGTEVGLVDMKASEVTNGSAGDSFKGVVETILGFLQVISGLLSVVIIAVTGFKYITETPDMRNELKKSMVPIVVGLLLVFFATTIAKFFIGVFEAHPTTNGSGSATYPSHD